MSSSHRAAEDAALPPLPPGHLGRMKPGCAWISVTQGYVIGRRKPDGEWYISRFTTAGVFDVPGVPAPVQAEVRRRLSVQ